MGSQIKKLLDGKSKSIKKYQIANEIGITPQTLYNWQEGLTEPSISQFQKLKEVIEGHKD